MAMIQPEHSDDLSDQRATKWLVGQIDKVFIQETGHGFTHFVSGELDQPPTARIRGLLFCYAADQHPVGVQLESCVDPKIGQVRRVEIADSYLGGKILESYLINNDQIVDNLTQQPVETGLSHLSYWLSETKWS
jgi:hypothetical protein